MVELIELVSSRRFYCYTVFEDCLHAGKAPFLTEDQARIATQLSEEEWTTIKRSQRLLRAVGGAPKGYLFFGLIDGEGNIYSIVVSGPFGILPGIYGSTNEATEAAVQDWHENNENEPVIMTSFAP